MSSETKPQTTSHTVPLPRISITFCTQCRWMLRAAYFAQELLSTFSGTTLGEVALVPATGGLFQVHLTCLVVADGSPVSSASSGQEGGARVQTVLLWDRKAEGGFPETKVLKQKVRDWIEPKRDLGHSDVGGKKDTLATKQDGNGQVEAKVQKENCEDCK